MYIHTYLQSGVFDMYIYIYDMLYVQVYTCKSRLITQRGYNVLVKTLLFDLYVYLSQYITHSCLYISISFMYDNGAEIRILSFLL